MKVIQNKWIPFKGYKYINLFGLIFTRIDEALAYDAAVNSKLTQAKNQTYNVVERLMDDPSYIERAKQVKTQFGDDYI
uniref:hypothetical protein n=1 Tax=Lachnospira sp. TaxID=2049031 RepID=UPI003FEDC151